MQTLANQEMGSSRSPSFATDGVSSSPGPRSLIPEQPSSRVLNSFAHCPTAVDRDDLARDWARFAVQKKASRPGNILGAQQTSGQRLLVRNIVHYLRVGL